MAFRSSRIAHDASDLVVRAAERKKAKKMSRNLVIVGDPVEYSKKYITGITGARHFTYQEFPFMVEPCRIWRHSLQTVIRLSLGLLQVRCAVSGGEHRDS